jgi:hypothetical protein
MMSEPPVAVTVVTTRDGEEVVGGVATFDNRDTALDAVDVLMQMFAFDEEGKRIEIEHV